jgi:hypothetical protein
MGKYGQASVPAAKRYVSLKRTIVDNGYYLAIFKLQ